MKKIILLFIYFFSTIVLRAQDVHFSQFSQTPQLLNPGATGVYNGYIRGIINYKNQWQAMGNAFSTMAASVDAPLLDYDNRSAHIGLGGNFFSDKAGDSKLGLTQFNICISGILPVTRQSKLSLGISFGGAQLKADLSSLQWANQYDGKGFNSSVNPNENTMIYSSFYVDLSAGLYYEYSFTKARFARNEEKRIAFGVAYFHINRPEQKIFKDSEKLYGKLVANVDSKFDLDDSKLSLIPSGILFWQGKSIETTIGMALRYRLHNGTKITGFFSEAGIALGIHYRFKDAIIPQIYYEVKDLAIGVSYDINMSKFSTATKYNGGIEVSIKYHMLKGALFKQRNVN